MLTLTVSRAGEHIAELSAAGTQPVTIGGSESDTLALPDGSLGRERCVLAQAGEQWVLTDRTGGGVRVNSVDGVQHALSNGDIIGLGAFTILVGLSGNEARDTPKAPPESSPAPDASFSGTSAPQGAGAPGGQDADKTVFRPRPTFQGSGPNALEIVEGPGLGLVRKFEQTLRIGRSQACDLVLEHPSISREHGLVSLTRRGWEAKSLNDRNPLTVNGQAVRIMPVKTGDVLGVGPARLRLVLVETAKTKPGLKIPELPGILRNRKLLVGIGGGLLLLLVATLLLSGPDKKAGEAVLQEERRKEQAAAEAQSAGKITTLLEQGRLAALGNNLDQALASYQAVLAIQPGNAEAVQATGEIRGRVAERDAQIKERERKAAELHGQVVGFIVDGDRLLSQGKFEDAAKAAGKALAVSPDDKEARDLLDKIAQASEIARQQAEEKARQQAETRTRLRDMYAKADEFSRTGQLFQAMKLYRDASAEDTDRARSADAKAKAARLQDTLVKQVLPDYNQGLKFYSQKKYREAMACWRKVLDVYPEARETNAKVAELRPAMEAEARKLYEEGLVYEGLGNRQEAMNKWQAVLDVAPFEDNPYRRKAQAKLGN